MRRRTFIFGTLAAATAVVVGWGVLPPRERLRGGHPLSTLANEIALNAWIKLARDGTVTLAMPRSEMGQGVHTALAMLVAEELECAWSDIRIEQSPIDKIYGNVLGLAEGVPFHPGDEGHLARGARWIMLKAMREMGFMMTGGSASIRDLWQPLREAAAMTRASLVNAAASAWGVSAQQVQVVDGVLTHTGGRRLSYGDALAQFGGRILPAESYRVKDPAQYRLIGRATPRLDSRAKTLGSALFTHDELAPGTLSAAVRMCPTRGGEVKTFDDTSAKALPGVRRVVRFDGAHGGSGGVAVIADSHWQAQSALGAIEIQWIPGPMENVSTSTLYDQLTSALDEESGYAFWEVGDVDAALSTVVRKIEAQYRAPYLAHATLEPMCCTVAFKDGRAKVWAPTQVPDFARTAAAKALGIDEDKVEIIIPYLGGGFGRRLEVDFIAQAANIARQLAGETVRILWSREDDMSQDFYRPGCIARFAAGIDAAGALVAWRNTSAGQAIVPGYMPRNAGMPVMGPDKSTAEGAFDQAYEIPNARIAHVSVELPVPVGFWRAVGHSHQAFFKESFLDECAHATQADPIQYRAKLLANRSRHLAVLNLAAEKSGWGEPLAAAANGSKMARGIALHESFGSIVAQVAEVSLDANGRIRVHRVVCAVDCGIAVNPNIIQQQMESAIVFGLSAALHGQIDFDNGQVKQGNFHDYSVLRMDECPRIETHIVQSTEFPGGIGEPGLPPIAPAVANALFALNGQRLRTLPLKPT